MNKSNLIGRLTTNPILKFAQTSGTAITTFTIAVNRRFKKEGYPEADFISIVQFGKGAEATANYMTKGKLVSVSGSIQTRNYEAKDGHKVYVTEIIADEVNFLEKKDNNTNINTEATEVTDSDGEIPF